MQNPEQQQARERFWKRLTQNDVEKAIFSFEDQGRLFCLDVVDSTGEAWVFLGSFLSINGDKGSVDRPISWPQFVSEKALKADDEVVFVRQSTLDDDDDQAPWKKFNVEIKRKIRLFGQDIWGDLMV